MTSISFADLTLDTGYSWKSAKKRAKKKGGRLPECKEVRKLTKDGALYPGQDVWAPCTYKGEKDWVQVGDKVHAPGKSHTHDLGGYPGWGDSEQKQVWNRIFVVTGGFKKSNLCYGKTDCGWSWASAKKAAKAQGGKLPKLKQIRSFLNGKPLYPGEDVWVACRDGDIKDWVQVGNKVHSVGKSHVSDLGGYPGWGDSGKHCSWNCCLMVFGAHAGKKKAVFWQKTLNGRSWKSAAKRAKELGGRLPTATEVEKLSENGAIFPGEDQWVACTSNGEKDWCQIGDKVHTVGKSHVHGLGGYPGWGDSDKTTGWNCVYVVVRGRKGRRYKKENKSDSDSSSSGSSSSSSCSDSE